MAYPPYKTINLDDLQEYDNFEIYDEYIKDKDPVFYSNLDNPQLTEFRDNGATIIEGRMDDAVRFLLQKA